MMNINWYRVVFIIFGGIFVLSTSVVHATDSATNAYASASAQVVIINQVRGKECCDPGTVEAFKLQIETLRTNGLSAAFAIRYDALKEKQYTDIFSNLDQNKFQAAAFLEITPGLAKDSGVNYAGDVDHWYQAQHAYSIGYSLADRFKIVDQYMSVYHQRIGSYPELVVSWMLDTATANYLISNYNVTSVEITREQWGTDSYTLSGGPAAYPYFASQNWLLVPQPKSEQNSLVVIRQTGSDLLRNYGDTTSAFTTQPNDYIRDGKSFTYFEKLADINLKQPHDAGILVLGLENSMPMSVQAEYIRQLEWVSKRKHELQVVLPKQLVDDLRSNPRPEIRVAVGTDVTQDSSAAAYWITTDNYQLRVLSREDGLWLTDYRFYSPQLNDPYNEYQAQNQGFWVVPFILQSSRFYNLAPTTKQDKPKIVKWLQQHLLPENQQNNQEPKLSKSDLETLPSGLLLTSSIGEISGQRQSDGSFVIEQRSGEEESSNLIKLSFNQSGVTISGANLQDQLTQRLAQLADNLPYAHYVKVDSAWLLKWDQADFGMKLMCQTESSCYISVFSETDVDFDELRQKAHGFLFPELTSRPASNEHTVLYGHTTRAVAGRNPARIVLITKDEYGFQVAAPEQIAVESSPPTSGSSIKQQDGHSGVTFIDILNNQPGAHDITVKVNQNITKKIKVYFTPDCSKLPLDCITNPANGWRYLEGWIFTFLRSL